MTSARNIVLIIQALTFIALGVLMVLDGDARLGVAQFMLAVITVLVYA